METGKPSLLTEEDCRRIEQAVQTAEHGTRAEIVPMIVARSGLYREARHYVGVGCALLALTTSLLLEANWLAWGWHAANAVWLLAATMAAYGLGVWLGGHPFVTRLMTSRERRSHKVRLRAERGFSQLGVARTRERTGVLLMVSLLERQVYVMADRSLAETVPQGEWQAVVEATLGPIKDGKIADGLCAGIERCGIVLARVAPARAGENPNELPDRLRIEP